LNVDYDEDDYLRAAQQFTSIFRSGDLSGLLQTNYRPEHPQLAKIILGASLIGDPERPLVPDQPTTAQPNRSIPKDLLRSGRITNAVFGTLTAGLLALVNPLGGFFLAIHSWSIKYTSELMLEAIPALTSFLCVLAYLEWKKRRNVNSIGWFVVSGIFLGLTAASKYLYCIVGVAIFIDWMFETKTGNGRKTLARNIIVWVLITIVVFILFDPYLWPDPLNRLKESILYHTVYSLTASEVKQANYPFWQQFTWLSTSPRVWQPNSLYFTIDPLIALLAVIGLYGTWKKQRLYVIWLVVTLLFLLFWPTKWPQYLVTFSVPLCYAAGEGVNTILIRPVKGFIAARRRKSLNESQTIE
jgi:4-amino-4-deoxy-L-arabinose transferase-like glycosyltransferase